MLVANKENFLALADKSKSNLDKRLAKGKLSKLGYDNAVSNNEKWIDFLNTLPDGTLVTPEMVQNWNVETGARSWALWQYVKLS